MSVLVACTGLNLKTAPTEFGLELISEMPYSSNFLDALEYWAVDRPDTWVAVSTWNNRLWDDWLNDALDGEEHLQQLKDALALLAGSCDEVAIWYAGFPDEIPISTGPREFVEAVVAQVAAGEIEPAARMIRRR